MIVRATTRCWGVVVAAGFLLPILAASSWAAEQTVPPPVVTTPTPPSPPQPPPAQTPSSAPGPVAPVAPAGATPAPVAAALPPPKPPPPPFVVAFSVELESTSSRGLALSAAHALVVSSGETVTDGLEARTLTTGEAAWRSPLAGWQAMVASDATVFGVTDGRLHALDAATGRTRWTTAVTGESPRLSHEAGWLVVVTSSEAVAFGAEAGTLAWRVALTSPAAAPAALDPVAVTVALEDASLVSYDLATGAERWRISTGLPARTISTTAAQVFAGLEGGSLCGYRASDGGKPWCQRLGVPMAGPPIVDDRHLYVVLRDNTLRQFDRLSGSMRRQDELGHRPTAGATLSGTSLAIPLSTGEFVLVARDGPKLTRVAPTDASTSTQLHGAAAKGDGTLLATLTIPPGGRLSLTIYRPPVVAEPPAAAPVPATTADPAAK